MAVQNVPVTVVRLDGELNSLSGPKLKQHLHELFTSGTLRVIIDLSNVVFIDSMGLGALVSGLKNAKQNGGNLVLVGLCEQARTIFELTMAFRIFDLFPTMEEAQAFLEER